MPTVNEFIETARTWIGVPYKQSGSHRNGANCIGLLIGIAREAGLETIAEEAAPHADFAHPPESGAILKIMKEYLNKIPMSDSLPGDIMLFKIGREPQHIALLTEFGIILHADIHSGKTVEHKLPETWRPIAVFRIKELDL